jgi:Spy/CpxP family protein refolding chaperone
MKKNLMLVGAMLISTIIFAQRESMKTVLSLNDAQAASIKEINTKYGQKHQDLYKEREAEISKVLTPEQNTKWTAYKKERHEKRMKEREERMKQRYSLTDEQVQKLRQLREENEAKMKSILGEEQYKKMRHRGRRH